MRQVVQNIRSGRLSVALVPAPVAIPGHVLVGNQCSLVSAGTEKMAMDLAKKSLFGKAMERPDQVRRVLEKLRQEGVLTTVSAVRSRLDEPMSLGYCAAGKVLAVGAGVEGFRPGDLVASNGPHAGIVCVPQHLCAKAPDGVSAEHACFAVLGAVAIQGVRLTHAQLGDTVFVIGLGLVGQLTVALLAAQGCRIIGTDLEAGKCALALRMGAHHAVPAMSAAQVEELTGGLGADAVIIAASTTSDEPVSLAGDAVRQKGRVVAVGAVGMKLPRRPYYFKEAEFVVSCSYGPGRYDPEYEQRGHDYPAAYVRWTEQRNLQAVLDLMARRLIDVAPLITHRYPIARAEDAYQMIDEGSEAYLGIVLEYPASEPLSRRVNLGGHERAPQPGQIRVGCIGAGSFARSVLIPAINKAPQLLPHALCSAGGLSAVHSGERFGFAYATSDAEQVFADSQVDAVFVITRHDQHASLVLEGIRARKHVFVEKPLCLTVEELGQIDSLLAELGDAAPLVLVGFNRRFSPAALAIRSFFADLAAPLTVSIRFNAGAIPSDHWTQDLGVGGGRIIGEACHAIDLATYLVASLPVRVYADAVTEDQAFITLRHANGSISSIGYLAGGDRAFPKERVEVFGGGRVGVIDDFRETITVSGGKTKKQRGWQQDKGHRAEVVAFAEAIARGGRAPIPWTELRSVSLASILALRSIREGVPFELPECRA